MDYEDEVCCMSREYDEELGYPERKSRRNPRMTRQAGEEGTAGMDRMAGNGRQEVEMPTSPSWLETKLSDGRYKIVRSNMEIFPCGISVF